MCVDLDHVADTGNMVDGGRGVSGLCLTLRAIDRLYQECMGGAIPLGMGYTRALGKVVREVGKDTVRALMSA